MISMKYFVLVLVPVICLYFVYKTILALAMNASKISREEEFALFKAENLEEDLCNDCSCYDSDYGQCTMASIDRLYACPKESVYKNTT